MRERPFSEYSWLTLAVLLPRFHKGWLVLEEADDRLIKTVGNDNDLLVA